MVCNMIKKKFKGKRLYMGICFFYGKTWLCTSSNVCLITFGRAQMPLLFFLICRFKWLIVPKLYQPYSFEDFLVFETHTFLDNFTSINQVHIVCQLSLLLDAIWNFSMYLLFAWYYECTYSYMHTNHFRSRHIPFQWCNHQLHVLPFPKK